ncbi:MAG TPA: DNA polymerase III subunit gamma and tau [Nocardioidaceae bacterium]|nr:DNA polymerase III subunit gamma and tau [Nocardioidaceae bacterium]
MSERRHRVQGVDAPLALYRRYRPESFGEVIGQDHVTDPLRAALRNNRVNHAYLFSGPRGCGKTTSARILARALNCEKGPTDEPCGICRSCTDLARGGPGSVDVIEIDAASHGGVDDARDLRERAFFAPVASRYKVYIIDEAHMVTTQGFNALLKLVEEPPPHLKFIFATTEPEKVIGTIRSRTHHYPFRLIPPRTLSAYLSELCEREGVKIEPAALPLVVRAGAGSARDSLSVLDQLIGGASEAGVTYELTTGLLGFTPDTLLDEVVDAFAASDGRSVFGVVDKVIETGQDPRRFTEDLLRRLRDLVIISAVPDATASGLVDVPEDQGERLVAQAARFGRSDLTRAADLVAAGLTELKGATAPRLLLELICARVLLPGADDSTDGLAARMDRLEKRMSMAPMVEQPPAGRAATPSPSEASVSRPPAPEAPAEPPAAAPAPVEPPVTGDLDASSAQGPTSGSTSDSGSTSGFGITDLRRLWPDVVDAVKHRRRMTWILLSQHAQVVDVDASTLTIGFNNPGAHQSFLSGGNDEIVRQVLIDQIGQAWKIEAIVDPSAQAGEPAPKIIKSAVAPVEAPSPVSKPDVAADARQAIQETRQAGPPPKAEPSVSDADADPDDPDADDHALAGAELLQRELGASVIEEISHE